MNKEDNNNLDIQALQNHLFGRFAGKLDTITHHAALNFSRICGDPQIYHRVLNIKKSEEKVKLLYCLMEDAYLNKSISEQKNVKSSAIEKIKSNQMQEFNDKNKRYRSLLDDSPAITIQMAAEYLNVSTGFIKSLVKDKVLREVYIRSKPYISKKDIIKLFDELNED